MILEVVPQAVGFGPITIDNADFTEFLSIRV
jgi:hypothetical protein